MKSRPRPLASFRFTDEASSVVLRVLQKHPRHHAEDVLRRIQAGVRSVPDYVRKGLEERRQADDATSQLRNLQKALLAQQAALRALKPDLARRLEDGALRALVSGASGLASPEGIPPPSLEALQRETARALEAVRWLHAHSRPVRGGLYAWAFARLFRGHRGRASTRGPLPSLDRITVAAHVAASLEAVGIRATRSRDGVFAKVLAATLRAADMREPEDLFDLVKQGLWMVEDWQRFARLRHSLPASGHSSATTTSDSPPPPVSGEFSKPRD